MEERFSNVLFLYAFLRQQGKLRFPFVQPPGGLISVCLNIPLEFARKTAENSGLLGRLKLNRRRKPKGFLIKRALNKQGGLGVKACRQKISTSNNPKHSRLGDIF